MADDDVIDDGIEDDEELDDENTPDEDEDDEEFVPPTKEQHAAMVAALEKANREAKERRLELRELRKQQTGAPAGDPPKDDGKPVDEARLRASVESEVIGTWKPLVIRSAATSALTAAGVIGSPDRLLKLIDVDDVDVDPATGKIDGIDDAVADLKREYPHLFRRKAGSRRLDAGDRKPGSRTEKLTDSQIQAAQLRGEL